MAGNFVTQTVLKKDIYSTLKNALINAGWVNISSKPATDYDVFYSKGTSGNMNLYFQMREYDSAGANQFSTTTSPLITVRMIDKYTPGTTGVAGTFARPSEPWITCVLFSISAIGVDATCNLFYNVDLNRIIFAVEPPNPFGLSNQLYYIGMPTNTTLINEVNSSGVLVAGTGIKISAAVTNQLYVDNNPYVPTTTSYVLSTSCNLPPKNLNSTNSVFISDVLYGNTSEGIRGTLDSVYVMAVDNVLDGDILVDGNGQKYRVLVAPAATYKISTTTYTYYSSFPTSTLAFPVE